ncbi:unnamed protein product [Hermetia illucens]|uniref:Uncharacterized protein n=1 Tax=Hermetia illucens TaxID=343691 RepID=A0A7R8YZD1_HERIL|nr:unnamed protein product [Hermetia illucens]
MPKCKGPDALDDEPKTKPKNGLKATEPDLPKTASAPQTTALAARPPPEPLHAGCIRNARKQEITRRPGCRNFAAALCTCVCAAVMAKM